MMEGQFEIKNADKIIENMNKTLEGVKNLVNIQSCLKAVSLMKAEVDKHNIFKQKLQQVCQTFSRKALNDLQSMNIDLSLAKSKDKDNDVEKYKIAYETNIKMLSIRDSFEKEMMKIKASTMKIDEAQEKRIEYISKIDISLSDSIIPEVKRRRIWNQLSDNFVKLFKDWQTQEEQARSKFLAIFDYKEIPAIFGELLLPELEYHDADFIESSQEVKDSRQLITSFLEKSKAYYANYKEEYEKTGKQNIQSTMKREIDELKLKLRFTEDNLHKSE